MSDDWELVLAGQTIGEIWFNGPRAWFEMKLGTDAIVVGGDPHELFEIARESLPKRDRKLFKMFPKGAPPR